LFDRKEEKKYEERKQGDCKTVYREHLEYRKCRRSIEVHFASLYEVLKNKRYRLGIKGIRKKIAGIHERYPDLKLSIDFQTTEGDWVVTSYIMNGTQLGNWMGIIPTVKPLKSEESI